MLPGNRALVDDLIPIPSHRPRCPKSPPPCTPRCCRRWIPVPSRFHPHALSWWCLALAVTHEKHYISPTSLVVQVYRLACLPDVILETVQKTWPPASGFIWSWYTCCLTKLYCRGIASRLNALIISLFLKLLSMMEVLSANNHQLS